MSYIVNIRPNGTNGTTGVFHDQNNNVPGSISSILSDNNDGTYVFGVTFNSSCDMDMTSYTLTNERCTRMRSVARLQSNNGSSSFDSDIWVRPVVAGDCGVTHFAGPSGGFTNFIGNWCNGEWDQNAINQVRFNYRENFGGVTVANISEAYIDLEIQAQPVVTGVGPTGTGVTLTPTITWTNNFQGDTQNANVIRIYRTSDNALIFDSGRVSVRTSQGVGTLAANTQYRAEVYAATDFLGTDWYSAAGTAIFTTNVPPTATVTAPTGTVLTTTPTVTWTYSDPESNPQSQYQVKIFSLAQYSIGGFNPETSPNTWDSGVTAGAATSRVVGTPLVGAVYRSYVKVSDANAGFGAWSFLGFTEAWNGSTNITDALGDLSATATSTTSGSVTLTGLGDLTAFASFPDVCGPLGYAGGWYGGASVYGGYGYCPSGAVTPIDPPAVKSNVLDIDDSIGRLGCGDSSFFITSRCAGTVTCVLDGHVTSAKWERKLDDVSTAEVTVDLSGDAASVCCSCLSDTEPWCHELHIWRDGDEVWCGPIQEIEYSYNQVTIRASDSLAWLNVRIPIANIHPLVDEDITTTALGVLALAFSNDEPTYTCEFANIFSQPTGFVAKLFYEAFKDTSLQILRKIADLGLNFTTLGRTIVLVGSTTPLTPLVLLNDEHIIGNIQVTKDGTLQGNRYYVHFDGDFGLPASGEAIDKYCYNDIERVLDGLGLVTGAQAAATGDSYAAATSIAPRMVVVPDGSRLSPDTPWTINQMVPGTRVDVAVTRLCLDLTQSFILTGIEVTYSNTDGESVGISLVPLNDSPTIPH